MTDGGRLRDRPAIRPRSALQDNPAAIARLAEMRAHLRSQPPGHAPALLVVDEFFRRRIHRPSPQMQLLQARLHEAVSADFRRSWAGVEVIAAQAARLQRLADGLDEYRAFDSRDLEGADTRKALLRAHLNDAR